MRLVLVDSHRASPILYPLETKLVNTFGGLEKSLFTVILAQLCPWLPNPTTTKFQDGEDPLKTIGAPAQFIEAVPVKAFSEVDSLSWNKAHSMPVSAEKKALLVSRAEVPNLISPRATLATPKAIESRILDMVTEKSITNPLLCFGLNFFILFYPVK